VTYSVAVFPLVVVLLVVGYVVLIRSFPIDIHGVGRAHELLSKKIHSMGKVGYNEYAIGTVLIITIIAWVLLGNILGLATIALSSVVVLFIFRLVRPSYSERPLKGAEPPLGSPTSR
jgi:di/tricarboxylate transporter